MAVSRRRPLFLILLFLVTQYFFLDSPLFQFRELTIDGTERIPMSTIEEHLDLGRDDNYWHLSPSTMEAELTTGLHQLQDAEVKVTFPGRVQVSLSERQPSFFVTYVGAPQEWYSVDSEGLVLESARATSDQIRVLVTRPVREGSRMRQTDLQVVKFFQDHLNEAMQEHVRAVKFAGNGEVTLKVKFGAEPIWVRFGRAEKLQYKLFLLEELITQLVAEKEEITAMDLRYSAPVVTKRVSKGEPESSSSDQE